MTTLPPCPKCASAYTYEDMDDLICPECAYQWTANDNIEGVAADDFVVIDASGNSLADGDQVTLIKDLKLKGSSSVLKVGTKIKINRLVDKDHNIDCRIEGHGNIALKSEFVRKVNP
jgi:protein PhnA